MRTLAATIIGMAFWGMIGPPEAEAVNIRVREVRREAQAQGLSIVYELENASVRRWDLNRVEVHVFNQKGRRIDLLRPIATLTRMERYDVELIRVRIPSALFPEAHHLELRVFVDEFTGYPVANQVPKRLDYYFPLAPQSTPTRRPATQARFLRAAGQLQVERAGMVEWEGSPRAIVLRVVNTGRDTLSDVVLQGEVVGSYASLQQFHLPVTPMHLPPGAEAYVSLVIPKHIVSRAKSVSLQALYRKANEGEGVRYVEDLKIRGSGETSEPKGHFKPAGLGSH